MSSLISRPPAAICAREPLHTSSGWHAVAPVAQSAPPKASGLASRPCSARLLPLFVSFANWSLMPFMAGANPRGGGGSREWRARARRDGSFRGVPPLLPVTLPAWLPSLGPYLAALAHHRFPREAPPVRPPRPASHANPARHASAAQRPAASPPQKENENSVHQPLVRRPVSIGAQLLPQLADLELPHVLVQGQRYVLVAHRAALIVRVQ